ncbi:hypothetical protein ASD04_15190 [Devosia sp. Root436]|jgi:hypothetical protein|uniref:hypothetical protein n=1 Tax=Devosia sp. Root436 TaxID=1736537 RepID=UPI0006F43B5A|nr:hypothetical protein [Devosia sp. Root436]KQX34738.1 hypothetical protein ASD04_15190 [Devosia sp. Root436]
MRPALPLALAIFAAAAAPALATPACSGSFGMDRERYSEAEINAYNLDLLRSIGVDVTRAEMWGGCIRVWVRGADGREEMQFYEPSNLRRVE